MSTPIPDARALEAHELALARWMLTHGTAEALPYLQQLEAARVASRCPCGCASIDFEVAGSAAPSGGLTILGDYVFEDTDGALAGAFIFARSGALAGIEVYGLVGEAPRALPSPESLQLLDEIEPRGWLR
jgi:hypothetical protein